MDIDIEAVRLAAMVALACVCFVLVARLRALAMRVNRMDEDLLNRATLMPRGPVGPAGPPGLMGPAGPAASCRCADAEAAAQDARTPQEKRTATLRLHKLIREGKMPAPKGWKPPRKRKKKARSKKKKAS